MMLRTPGRPAIAAAFLLTLMGTSRDGRAAALPPTGSRVRVTPSADSTETTLTGRLEDVVGDTLVVRANDEPAPRTITINRVRLLEVSRGVRGHAGRGALIGFAAGAAAGVAAGVVSCEHGCSDDGNDQTVLVAGAYGLLAGFAGLGIGAVIGNHARGERWQRVPLSEVGVGVQPSGGGRPMFAATFTRRF
jgi:hypothetical protein